MLVLTRKVGESIALLDSEVLVTILEIRGDRVRLGMAAPKGVPVYREEIWQRIARPGNRPGQAD